ncbi:linear gramicidin synthetase subunit D domain protein [Mycobacterium xenopi 4042]|uniref:Linear gramicidin synthetase subunit D domain protein n=1 Tax=Mycobacterium xenopi 4042 TaxID=1299334 RepID=X7ZPX0_MYCXE|nr:linear gramicidin synthetase subunit D domain protein [Mycobacterium xenopi 4042]
MEAAGDRTAVLPAVRPELDTFATAGHLSAWLDSDTTGLLLAEASTAFHAGVHELLLIALALAVRSSWATGRAGRYRRRGPRPPRGTRPRHRFVAHGRVVHDQTPVSLAVGGLSWAQVAAGEAALGR